MSYGEVNKMSVQVVSFFETAKDVLSLELAAGESGLSGSITEAAINRPGMALTGFFQYFSHRRIQVIGLAEHTYLATLDSSARTARLREVFEQKIPCVVATRGKKLFPELTKLAEEFKVPVFKTKMITKNFINASTIIMENLMAPRKKVQGTMVEIMGIGVLIEGKPGMGKSETALALIKKGYALVSDDITSLRLDSAGAVIGSPVALTRYHMEVKGLGIIHVPSLFGVASVRNEKRLDLVVSLCPHKTGERMDEETLKETAQFLGVDLPRVYIPVAAGRDIANIVETAALNEKLKRLGHDAVKELDEKLMQVLSEGKDGSE